MADSVAGHNRIRNAHELIHIGIGESMLSFLKVRLDAPRALYISDVVSSDLTFWIILGQYSS